MDWSKKLLSAIGKGWGRKASEKNLCAPISAIRLEALEDRVLFDASLLGELVRSMDSGGGLMDHGLPPDYILAPDVDESPFLTQNPLDEDWSVYSSMERLEAIELALNTSLDEVEKQISLLRAAEQGYSTVLDSASMLNASDTRDSERLYVVDGSIEGSDSLINDLFNRGVDESSVLLLDPDKDGVAQISRWISQFSNVSELHLFAHANPEHLQIGSTLVSLLNVGDFAGEFLSWQGSMAGDADWLIYGCDLASADSGRALMGELAEWTGMDIGASSDLSGTTGLGGDWHLEFGFGDVEARSVFENGDESSSPNMAWTGLLNLPVAVVSGDLQETSAIGRGNDRALAMHSDGSFVVVWSEDFVSGDYGVRAQRFDANGIPVGSVLTVNQEQNQDQQFAAIGMDSSGNFVITWTSNNQDGNQEGIYARQFAADGTAIGNEFRVNSFTNGRQQNSKIAVADNGSFVVVWEGQGSGDSHGIFGQRFNSSGGLLGANFLINTVTANNQYDSSVSINSSGAFVVSWDDNTGFHYQRFNSSGTAAGGPVEVSGLSSAGNGSILLNDDGSIAVTWRSTTLGLTQTYVKVYDSADNLERLSLVNDITLTQNHSNPSISGSGAGSFVITWEGTSEQDVLARRFNADGTYASSVLSVTSQDSGLQKYASVSAISSTQFGIAWTDQGDGSQQQGVYVRTFGISPELDTGRNPTLNPVDEGFLNSTGTLISALLPTGSVTDGTGFNGFGMAIVGLNDRFGTWQFSLNNGTSWSNIDSRSINSQVNELALHLGPSARIRLIPYGNLNGSLADGVTFRAWDARVGTEGQYSIVSNPGNGISPYSSATDTASLSIAAVNDTPTFDLGQGYTTNSLGSTTLSSSLIQQVDGKTLVTGRFNNGANFDIFVIRYNTNGSLDSTFGTNGIATFDLGAADDWSNAIQVRSDGKIVIGGHSQIGGLTRQVVMRLDSNGVLDSTFGSGGIFTNATGTSHEVLDLKLMKDGKILFVGATLDGYRKFTVVQLQTNGTLDSSFGTNGVVLTDFGNAGFARRVEIQDDGKILVGGHQVVGGVNRITVVRYLQNGAIDASYGVNGIVSSNIFANANELNSMALLRNGKLLIGATFHNGTNEDMVVLRLTQNGALDTTFQSVGYRTFDFGGTDRFSRIDVDHNDSIYLIGNIGTGPSHARVIKLQANGANDLTFGFGGERQILIGTFANGYAMSVQPDGALMIAGVANPAGILDNLLVRLDESGNIDSQFAASTSSFGGSFSFQENGSAIVLDSNVEIFDAELSKEDNYNGSQVSFERSGGADPDDQFVATGTLGALLPGGSLTVGGTVIGTVTTNSLGTLLLTFNNNATQSLVNQAVQQIAFRNSGEMAGSTFQIVGRFNDGNLSAAQGSGGARFATGMATFNVVSSNNAPTLGGSTPTLNGINEDDFTNPGQTVASILSSSGDPITDVDAGAIEGIAIIGLSSGNGTWQYSINNGGSWANVGTVSDSSALLLRDIDRVRFVPNGDNGTTAQFTFRAWDQTGVTTGQHGTRFDSSDNGGTRSFSTMIATASLTVAGVNDAPVLNNSGTMVLTTITEDQTNNVGNTIASIISSAGGNRITDIDSVAIEGVAITGLSSGNGTWQYSIDNGTSWSNIGIVTNSSALLLREVDRVRFVPDGDNATTAQLTFRAWDQTGVTSGQQGAKVDSSINGTTTPFSTASETASLVVSGVNDAPDLDNTGNLTLTTISENQTNNSGNTVASIMSSDGANRIIDVDTGSLEGIAIVGLNSGNGTWQYSINNGATWLGIGAVSGSNALLLRDIDHVRFVPNGQNGTTAQLTFRAWDQSGVTAGQQGTKVDSSINGTTTPFSTATETADLTVSEVNDAPVLNNSGTMVLTTITEDQTNNVGDTIASIILSAGGNRITDIDSGAIEGVAITGLGSGNGTWEYSIDGGLHWTAIGAVANSNALLLRGIDQIRFVPDGDNSTSESFTFRAWDQSGGTSGHQGNKIDVSANGGSTPFSSNVETASINVTSVNDAPILTPGAFTFTSITEDQIVNIGNSISEILASVVGNPILDVDAGAVAGIAVTGLVSGTGVWQYSTDTGSNWNAIGIVSESSALLLRPMDRIRFVPDGENGSVGEVMFRAWDRTQGTASLAGTTVNTIVNGETTPFSLAIATANLTIESVNDAPELQSLPSATLSTILATDVNNVGETVAAILASSGGDLIQDVDQGAIEGIAIYSLNSALGTWEYSLDGANWIQLNGVSTSSALLLRETDRIRFMPDGIHATTASFDFRGWDQTGSTIGQQGTQVDISINGNATPFSAQAATASIDVDGDAYSLTAIFQAGDTDYSLLSEGNGGLTCAGGFSLRDIQGNFLTSAVILVEASGQTNGLSPNAGQLLAMLSTNAVIDSNLNSRGRMEWTFDSGNEAFDYLGQGDQLRLVFDVQIADALTTIHQSIVIEIVATNDRPTLSHSSTSVAIEDSALNESGFRVSSVFSDSSLIADLDRNSVWGIAIQSFGTVEGHWQYQLAGASNWVDGVFSEGEGFILLQANDRLRFQPLSGSSGEGHSSTISFRAWDQTEGTRGFASASSLLASTSLSSTSATSNLTINISPAVGPPTIPGNTGSGGTTTTSTEDTKSDSDQNQTTSETKGENPNDSGTPMGPGFGASSSDGRPAFSVVAQKVMAVTSEASTGSLDKLMTFMIEDGVAGEGKSLDSYYERKIDAGKIDSDWNEANLTVSSRSINTDEALEWNQFFAGMDKSSEQFVFNQFEIGVPTFVASTASLLTVGYLAWIIRGGILLTTFMTSLPTWKMLDISPLLEGIEDQDRETIEQIVDVKANA